MDGQAEIDRGWALWQLRVLQCRAQEDRGVQQVQKQEEGEHATEMTNNADGCDTVSKTFSWSIASMSHRRERRRVCVCLCVCVCAQKREGRQKQGEKRRGGEYDINTKIDSVGGGCRGRSWHAQKIGSREQMVRRRKET